MAYQSAIDAGIRVAISSAHAVLLAADGSGARLISSSEGAANPCFAPDGSLCFTTHLGKHFR
jgi:hypothetical protein